MRRLHSFLYVASIVVLLGWFSACDSVDNMSTGDNVSSNTVTESSGVNQPFAAKLFEGTVYTPDCPELNTGSPSYPSDQLCFENIEDPDGNEWVVYFEGFGPGPDDPDTGAKTTAFNYLIWMPQNASQSGKITLEDPDCCQFAASVSDGNKNDNSAGDVEFNTDTPGSWHSYQYVFYGENVSPGVIGTGLKYNNKTESYPIGDDIYGPGPKAVFLSGDIFWDGGGVVEPDRGTSIFGDGTDDTGLAATVTLIHSDGTAPTVIPTDANGRYTFIVEEGTYTIKVSGTAAGFVPTTIKPNESNTYTVFSGTVSEDSENDFGFEETYTVEGYVFVDADGDYLMDEFEAGLDDIYVRIEDSLDGPSSASTDPGGMFSFNGIRWGSHALSVNENGGGSNASLFVEDVYLCSYSETCEATGTSPDRRFVFEPVSVSGDIFAASTTLKYGFALNVKRIKEALTSGGGELITLGFPREFWKVQITQKGTIKYKPAMSTDAFKELLCEIGDYLGGKPYHPFTIGPVIFEDGITSCDGVLFNEAMAILKTDSNNDPLERLHTEVFAALLNLFYDIGDGTAGTLLFGTTPISTEGLIDHALSVLSNEGYLGFSKIGSGPVEETTSAVSAANGDF